MQQLQAPVILGLLGDVATIPLDCGLRPEECFRRRSENVRDGDRDSVRQDGQRPPPHSFKKQHAKAIQEATKILRKQAGRGDVSFQGFELHTLRHTCLTRWAPHMDPWTLAYLAGLRDMNITKRYVHPQEQTIRAAMDRAGEVECGHTFGHTARPTVPEKIAPAVELIDSKKENGAPGETRTPDLLVRSQPLYPPELRARFLIITAPVPRAAPPPAMVSCPRHLMFAQETIR